MSGKDSPWTHNSCRSCWITMRGGEIPPRAAEAQSEPDTCCWCGAPNSDGIYLRHDPKDLRCYGDHTERES